jgi:hypothetical protein
MGPANRVSKMNETPNEAIRLPCSSCGGKSRWHQVPAEFKIYWGSESDLLGLVTVYQICRCMGCEAVRFRRYDWLTEEGVIGIEEIYPSAPKRSCQTIPERHLPEKVKRIYRETVAAFNAGLSVLVGGGLRAIVEAICQDKQVGGKNLEEKIDELVRQNLLAAPQAKFLHEERYIGNTALHEIEPPSEKELELGLQVVQGLLSTIYVLPAMAGQLEQMRLAKKTLPGPPPAKP